MAHNLDINEGQASFVSARQDAWHTLGITLPDAFTAEEAMEHGLLGGWNVRKAPLVAATDAGDLVPVPGKFAVVRDNPVTADKQDVLGVVGDAYHIVQNEEHAGILNALVDESGAHFETAGAIDGGRKVFITMKLPGHMMVGGVDRVDSYLAAVNSHDGTSSFQMMVTPVRIVCQNTLNAALRGASNTFRARHTRGISQAVINEARAALDLTFGYLDAFQAEAEALINTTMTQTEFERMVAQAFLPSEDAPDATQTRAANKVDQMVELFADASTHEGVRNTAWAGYNALAEWADHYLPTRGDDRDAQRALGSLFRPSFKDEALELVKRTAGLVPA